MSDLRSKGVAGCTAHHLSTSRLPSSDSTSVLIIGKNLVYEQCRQRGDITGSTDDRYAASKPLTIESYDRRGDKQRLGTP